MDYPDIMDDETEKTMCKAFENLDEYETRRLTRPVLFGDTFNPEIEKIDLPKLKTEKSPEAKNFLQLSIPTTLPFCALDSEQIEEVIQHFVLYHVKSGNILMREKEEGDYFYLIQTGIYQALIDNKQVKICRNNFVFDEENKFLYLDNNEGSFGELALLYN
jgi:CRP-like cAMP-binding protein